MLAGRSPAGGETFGGASRDLPPNVFSGRKNGPKSSDCPGSKRSQTVPRGRLAPWPVWAALLPGPSRFGGPRNPGWPSCTPASRSGRPEYKKAIQGSEVHHFDKDHRNSVQRGEDSERGWGGLQEQGEYRMPCRLTPAHLLHWGHGTRPASWLLFSLPTPNTLCFCGGGLPIPRGLIRKRPSSNR